MKEEIEWIAQDIYFEWVEELYKFDEWSDSKVLDQKKLDWYEDNWNIGRTGRKAIAHRRSWKLHNDIWDEPCEGRWSHRYHGDEKCWKSNRKTHYRIPKVKKNKKRKSREREHWRFKMHINYSWRYYPFADYSEYRSYIRLSNYILIVDRVGSYFMIKKDLKVQSNGEVIAQLNAHLIVQQDVSVEQVEQLKILHRKLHNLQENFVNLKTEEEIANYIYKVENIEFKMQEAWNFAANKDFHSHWFIDKNCTCPKLDNHDRLGSGYKVYSASCTVHGKIMNKKRDLLKETIDVLQDG